MDFGGYFNLPVYGLINPTLPVPQELVNRGERVTYCTSAEFKEIVEKNGADLIFEYLNGKASIGSAFN